MFIFKKAIKKNISTDEAEEILAKLNSFLDENSPQLTYWLAKVFKEQQNAMTYAELERAATAGFESEIRKWQEEYTKFVNEKLNPLWLLAMREGAKHFSEKYKNVFDDSDGFVKDWLNKHGAEFVTNINFETRQAIKSILAYGQDNGMSVKEIAKMIRPTIGLNTRQATANLNYQNKVRENLLQNNPRMTQAKAEEKAQLAALKYASKQHRQRAEMIAHTELAFSYNRGAHESVRQAMSNGLMGRCEKVWTTAGTNRVCGRCMDLSGTVVGFEDKFFNSSVTDGQTPPLHPRCRCVIVYHEIDEPRGKNTSQFATESRENSFSANTNRRRNSMNYSYLPNRGVIGMPERLPDGEYNLTVRRQVQNRHIDGTTEHRQYVEKLSLLGILPSVLSNDVNVPDVIREFHKKGIYDPNPKDNSPREQVNTGKIVGQYWDFDENKLVDTTWVEIVYSKKGVHIYPIRPQ